MPTSPFPAGTASATSQTRLRYQRPVASSLKLPDRMSAGIGRDNHSRYFWPRKVTVSPSILSGRSHWNGTHPRNRFGPRLTRQRGFRLVLSRLMANCLHTACTVSLWSPSSLLLPLVSLIRSKPDDQRRLSLRLSFWMPPQEFQAWLTATAMRA